MTFADFRPRALLAILLAGVAALFAAPASAVEEKDLLPVDQAFALTAEASGPDSVRLHWAIANGYYLYRHRTSATADAAFAAQPLQLPAGEVHQDPYFGRVETYRGALTGNLRGTAGPTSVTLKVRYQGCADAGLCYPPQTRTLTVSMPGASASALPGVLGAVSGAPRSNPLLGKPAGAVDTVPLPDTQAFRFEAIANDGNTLLLRFTPAPGYYLYRDKTELSLRAPKGIRLGAPRWPPATAHQDEHFGKVAVYFDQIDVPLPLNRTSTKAANIAITARFQGCQTDGICYPPMTRTVNVPLPAGVVGMAAADITPGASQATPAVTTAMSSATTPASQSPAPSATATPPPARTELQPATAPVAPALGLMGALLAALLGGFVLNLMPCVLPVLSLKALSLAGTGESPAKARRHAFAYTAGVLLSFVALGALALGLRQAGLALGWGFQLQQPLVVAALALLMFALGLSLSGVWHAGGRWTGVGQALTARTGPAGDFFTGVLAVVVATPCTAPFMGAALAWAFTAPTLLALLVFATLGFGMALPFLLIGLIPALAHKLPRPGAWMETLKQLLAFPLYLTAAWLAWVLARQRGADAVGWFLVAAVLLAFAAWAWNRGRMSGRSSLSAAAVVALLAVTLPLGAIQHLQREARTAAPSPQAFSERRLAELRAAGHVVFVNITADWCVSCKANEKTVFSTAEFTDALHASDAVYLVGDWTDVDPTLTAYLQRNGAYGVPLYMVYAPGTVAGRQLPSLLSTSLVRDALTQARRAR